MLFQRLQSPERSIRKLTKDLGLEEGDRVSWKTSEIGKCALKRSAHKEAGQYYELNAVELSYTDNLTLSASRFLYLPNGTILGVLRSELDPNNRNDEAVESGMDFQIDSGLFVPTPEEKQELVEILKSKVS